MRLRPRRQTGPSTTEAGLGWRARRTADHGGGAEGSATPPPRHPHFIGSASWARRWPQSARGGHQLFVFTHGQAALTSPRQASAGRPAPRRARRPRTPTSSSPWSPTRPTSSGAVRQEGVAAALVRGKTVVDMSSIRPSRPSSSRRRSTPSAATTWTRPSPRAKSAPRRRQPGPSWSVARQAAFDRVKPLFELMGKNITWSAATATGRRPRSPTRSSSRLNIAAGGEALVFASKAGADLAKVRQALMGGFGEPHPRSARRAHGQAATFAPGFRIGLHQKDLNLRLW